MELHCRIQSFSQGLLQTLQAFFSFWVIFGEVAFRTLIALQWVNCFRAFSILDEVDDKE